MKPWSALGTVAVLVLLPLFVLLAQQQAAYRRAERIEGLTRQLVLTEYLDTSSNHVSRYLREYLLSGSEEDRVRYLDAQRTVDEHEGALSERITDEEGRRLLASVSSHRAETMRRVELLLDQRTERPWSELAPAALSLIGPGRTELDRRIRLLSESRQQQLARAQEELRHFQSRSRLIALLGGLAAGAIVFALTRRAGLARVRELASLEALRHSEEQFKLLAESIPHLVWVANPRGEPTYANAQWSRFLVPASGRTLVDGMSAAVHEADFELLRSAWQQALARSEPFEAEFRLRERATGEERWVLSRAQPVLSADGQVQQWFGTCTDIDDTRRAQAALERSQAQLQLLWDANVIGVWRWGEDWRVVEANDAFLALIGRTRSEVARGELSLQNLTPSEWQSADDAALQAIAEHGAVAPYEKEYLRPDGVRVPVLVCGISVDRGATGLALVFDIGVRKRIEELQTQIVGVVSHDLRSPLSALTVTLGSLRRALGDDPRRAEMLDRSLRSLARMERIIRDLLDYTRTRTGRLLTIEPRPGLLRAMLSELAGELREANNRALEVSISGPDEVTWDLDRIAQAVQNLVSNAFKHGDADRPVRLRVSGDDERVRLEVENEGPELPEDLLQGNFEPFRASRAGERTVRTSYGLGLYIVRQIASAHGGRLEARSPAPRRVVFLLELPRRVLQHEVLS